MSTGHYAIRPEWVTNISGRRGPFFLSPSTAGPKGGRHSARPTHLATSPARSMQTLPTLPSFSLSSLLSFSRRERSTPRVPPPSPSLTEREMRDSPEKVIQASVPNGCAAEREEELPTRPALPTTRRPHRPLQAQRRVHPGAHTCRSCWVRRHGGACHTDDSNGGAGAGAGGGADAGPS